MTERLHEAMREDLPVGLKIPDNPWGLISLVMIKFGPWACIATVCIAGIVLVYGDMRSLNDKVLSAFVAQTETQAKTNELLAQMNRRLEEMR